MMAAGTMAVTDALPLVADNSSFSAQVPGLQVAIDSTSIGEFKLCPRRYYYSIIKGYQPRTESVHLTFGLLMHASVERYAHARTRGDDHQSSLQAAVLWALDF
jgi:hypothetical protein